jgi:Uma2 family endonuclease
MRSAGTLAEASVEEYWIVLGAERRIGVYRRPERGQYQEAQVHGLDDTLECATVPGVRLSVRELFA